MSKENTMITYKEMTYEEILKHRKIIYDAIINKFKHDNKENIFYVYENETNNINTSDHHNESPKYRKIQVLIDPSNKLSMELKYNDLEYTDEEIENNKEKLLDIKYVNNKVVEMIDQIIKKSNPYNIRINSNTGSISESFNVLSVTKNDKIYLHDKGNNINTVYDFYGFFKLQKSYKKYYLNFFIEEYSIPINDREHSVTNNKVSYSIKNNGYHSFNTREIPQNIESVSILVSSHDNTQVLEDILGGLKYKFQLILFSDSNNDKSEFQWNNTSYIHGTKIYVHKIYMESPENIANTINNARNSDILIIARGGGNIETFNDKIILDALNNTPQHQLRILGLGHSRDIPLAYFFADIKAQTPTAIGYILNKILTKHVDRKEIVEQNAKTIEKLNYYPNYNIPQKSSFSVDKWYFYLAHANIVLLLIIILLLLMNYQ